MDLGAVLLLLGGTAVLSGAEARVISRAAVGSQGSPLLLGPNGGGTTPTSDSNDKFTNPDTPVGDSSSTDDTNAGDSDSSSTSSSAPTPTSTDATSTSSPPRSATTTDTSSTQTSSVITSTTVTSQASSSSAPTAKTDRDVLDSGPPRQPSSVRYLVPVFLLILIGIAGFAFQKYRKRRKLSRRRSSAGKDFENAMRKGQDPFGGSGGWKQVGNRDDGGEKEGHDEEDPWYAGDVEDAHQLRWEEGLKDSGTKYTLGGADGMGLERSGGLISAGARGWGWKDSWNQFKSARGKLNEQAAQEVMSGGTGIDNAGPGPVERRTMKLVTSPDPNPDYSPTDTSGQYAGYSRVPDGERDGNGFVDVNIEDHTYQDVPIIHHRPPTDPEQGRVNDRGSIRALRDKLASLAYKTPLSPDAKQGSKAGRQNLERNRSPNKRSANPRSNTIETEAALPVPQAIAVPPSPPAWIRPRAVSPTSMSILSPPMQPHLFFHPAPLPSASGDGPGATRGTGHHTQMITDDHSVSDYASEYDETPIPSVNPSPNPADDHKADPMTAPDPNKNQSANKSTRFPRIPSTASGLAGADSFSVISNNKVTPASVSGASPVKGKSGLSPLVERGKSNRSTSKLNPANDGESGPGSSPLALRRSAASKSLSTAPPGTSPLSQTTQGGRKSPLLSPKDIPESEIARNKSLARAQSKSKSKSKSDSKPEGKKTRTQRKEERARDKVEDILKASWSDRALASPPLGLESSISTSSEGVVNDGVDRQGAQRGGGMIVPGLMSSGLEETGGIEQRLALLKNVVI
ncbi:hypothetical protein IAU59_004854 [Kwoniella sp. CBS 9459]